MEVAIPNLAKVALSYNEFQAVAGVGVIRNEPDYDRALALIEAILDETRDTPAREDATHPLADLLDLLTALVRVYEAVPPCHPSLPLSR